LELIFVGFLLGMAIDFMQFSGWNGDIDPAHVHTLLETPSSNLSSIATLCQTTQFIVRI